MHPHLSTASEALSWLQANDMRRVELVFADLTSVARGKIMSTASFAETQAAKMPSLFLGLTVTGGEPPQVFKRIFPPMFPDMAMRPKAMFRRVILRLRQASARRRLPSGWIVCRGRPNAWSATRTSRSKRWRCSSAIS